MDQSLGVSRPQAHGNLSANLHDLIGRQLAFPFDEAFEGFSFEPLHGQKGESAIFTRLGRS